MIPTLSQVCTLASSLEQEFPDFAAGQCRSVEIWFTKLEDYLKTHSANDFRRLRSEHAIATPVASYQGGLLASQGSARAEAWKLFGSRLDLCQELEIGAVVVACDVPAPLDQSAIERTRVSLVQAAQEAGRRGLRVALEFQARAALGNNLQTAAALVAEVASPHLGLCFDLFHFYTGSSKTEDLGLLHAHNLFHVQLSDLADTSRELATDGDRILPGDGDFQLAPLLDRLREIEYRGAVSVELMNPRLWQVGPRQFGEIAMTALRKTLGQASMD